MVAMRRSLVVGAAVLVLLLAALGATVGLGLLAWGVGLACAAVSAVALTRAGPTQLGPADLVTFARGVLTCAIAALVADSFVHGPEVEVLVTLAIVALVSDAVDGRVARRTSTSRFGAQFDGEVDALLILVLSVYVAEDGRWWVLAIGLARYAFGAAGWVLPWMRRQLPPRFWRKVVTAVQGIALTVAAAGVTASWLTTAALLVALALLAESFGRDVVWLWRRRSPERERLLGEAGRSRVPRP
jgi:phosphatidylglycerophosphate synthase